MSHHSQPPPPHPPYPNSGGADFMGNTVLPDTYQYYGATSSHSSGNPYEHVTPAPPSAGKGTTTDTLWKVLGRAEKKLEVTTRKAADVTGNVWTHRNPSPAVVYYLSLRFASLRE